LERRIAMYFLLYPYNIDLFIFLLAPQKKLRGSLIGNMCQVHVSPAPKLRLYSKNTVSLDVQNNVRSSVPFRWWALLISKREASMFLATLWRNAKSSCCSKCFSKNITVCYARIPLSCIHLSTCMELGRFKSSVNCGLAHHYLIIQQKWTTSFTGTINNWSCI